MSRQKHEVCVWTQFKVDKIQLSWDMLTPNMGGIGQPKQESWPNQVKRRNCLSKEFYGLYECEVTHNFDGFLGLKCIFFRFRLCVI